MDVNHGSKNLVMSKNAAMHRIKDPMYLRDIKTEILANMKKAIDEGRSIEIETNQQMIDNLVEKLFKISN
ncbi:hypothetical protein AKO1_014353 [Acrasis kona]|uniref:Cytochrome P450 n=1 Tax=Acrasis kona TaxID=1008807 RepID=A0AAW2Z098_9EUKA